MKDDLPVEFGCGRIPLEDILAYMDINRDPEIDEETLKILLKRGTYGSSWREIESYFQTHFSECPDCRTEYEKLAKDLETTQSGVDEIRRWARNYKKRHKNTG